MKKVFLLAGVLAVSSSGLFAQVPVARVVGDLTTIGGWDFNGGTATTVSTVNARYNQAFNNYYTAGTISAPGSALYNAVASFNNTDGATFGSNRSLASLNAAPNYQLLSNVGLIGSNDALGEQSTNARSILLSSTSDLVSSARATFRVSTAGTLNNFAGVQLQYSARNQGSAAADISFSYSLDGINFTALAGSTQTWNNDASFAVSNLVNFAAVTALDSKSQIWIGLNYAESAAAASVAIDNVAIYATAIPEPSTYAAIIAALTLGVVAIRRRKAVTVA